MDDRAAAVGSVLSASLVVATSSGSRQILEAYLLAFLPLLRPPPRQVLTPCARLVRLAVYSRKTHLMSWKFDREGMQCYATGFRVEIG